MASIVSMKGVAKAYIRTKEQKAEEQKAEAA